MQANRNRSKLKARVHAVIHFLLLNVSAAGVENGKMAWIRPQRMKLSKLIFESLLFQRAFNFKVLNTYEIAEMAIAF